jgi:putative transposase
MGRSHLMHILKQVEAHHNSERPHQGLDNKVPIPIVALPSAVKPDEIQCQSRLGGILNHYTADAAA